MIATQLGIGSSGIAVGGVPTCPTCAPVLTHSPADVKAVAGNFDGQFTLAPDAKKSNECGAIPKPSIPLGAL